MKKRRTLIKSPLEWQLTAPPVRHPTRPVVAERGRTQLRTPRPVLLIDTREQNPFSFQRFQGWFGGVEKRPLQVGDYSVTGLEELCVVDYLSLAWPVGRGFESTYFCFSWHILSLLIEKISFQKELRSDNVSAFGTKGGASENP